MLIVSFRKHGLIQLINIYNKMKDRCCDSLKWGDEIEYMICKASNNGKYNWVSYFILSFQIKFSSFCVVKTFLKILMRLKLMNCGGQNLHLTCWKGHQGNHMVQLWKTYSRLKRSGLQFEVVFGWIDSNSKSSKHWNQTIFINIRFERSRPIWHGYVTYCGVT